MVELNAFSRLTVLSADDADHVARSLTLERATVDPNIVPMPDMYPGVTEEHARYLSETWMPPHREPSKLPPPGDATLAISLGPEVDSGSSSIVYDIVVLDEELRARLPPLVVKIARPLRRHRVIREMFFYDQLESLQGVVLARCYGLFDAEAIPSVPAGCWAPDLAPDSGGSRHVSTSDHGAMESVMPKSPSKCSADSSDSSGSEWNDHNGALGDMLHATRSAPSRSRSQSPHPLEYETISHDDPAGPSSRVSILLLEKLGEKLPLGKKLDKIRSDIFSIGQNVAPFHVGLRDVRWSNILKAPEGPGTLPGIVSPFTGIVHGWRVIDLEASELLFAPVDRIERAWIAQAARVLDCLPLGRVFEPWEYE